MGAGSKPLRPWQVCAGDVIGSGKRVEYVFERYGELYINASDEELVRQGKRTYGEELTRLYDLDHSGWRVIGHYGCGRGYEGRSWYDMADIQKEGSGKHETDEVELKKISLLIPAWLHKEAQLHRVETGESMTKLIVRLLAEELG